MTSNAAPPVLLAVDLGLKAGFAVYVGGRLCRYHSKNFGSFARFKRAAFSTVRTLQGEGPLDALVVEGDRALGRPWILAAQKVGAEVFAIQADAWRTQLLPGVRGNWKEAADRLARRLIHQHGAPAPTSLRHDAAEAIAMGYWGCLQRGHGYGLPQDVGA